MLIAHANHITSENCTWAGNSSDSVATTTGLTMVRSVGPIVNTSPLPEEFLLAKDSYARWEDLRFPAAAINPPGLGSDPSVNTTYGWFEFSISDLLFFQAQLPHAWEEDSVLKPHIHWMKTTSASGVVRWELSYRWVKIGDEMDGSWTVLAEETPSVSDNDTQHQHALTAFGDITPSSAQVSDMLIMKVTRIAAVGSEYGADAVFLEFDIHYQVDSLGSEAEYVK